MTSYKATELFVQQLSRLADGTTYKTKVILTPTSVRESGLVCKVSLLKTWIVTAAPVTKKIRYIKLRVAICGTIESMTGLKQATEAIENLDDYLSSENLRLEETIESENSMQSVVKIPNTRIIQTINMEDSFVEVPDSTNIQDVEDVRTVTITIPVGD